MIYWELFWAFLQVGLFTFGGGYGSISLVRDAVLSNGWLTDDMFTNFLAICESTPGPIMVNMATYVGNRQGGVLGAVLATAGVVLPSFVIILLIARFLKTHFHNQHLQAILKGITACFIGIVLAMGVYLIVSGVFSAARAYVPEWQVLVIDCSLLALSFAHRRVRKKDISPYLIIGISAVLGVTLYSFP